MHIEKNELRAPLTFFRMPHLQLKGTWYEIGFAIGREFKHMVRWTINSYVVLHRGSAHENMFFDYLDQVHALFEAQSPNALEEIRGISDGAEVDWRLLLVANGFSSFNTVVGRSDGNPQAMSVAGSTECSNLIFPTSEFGPLLGATLDCAPTRFIATIDPPNGYRATYPLWPGLVSSIWGGLNERGLALAGASVAKHETSDTPRLFGLHRLGPQRHLMHQISNVEEAIKFLQQPKIRYEHNLSLLDAQSNGVQVHGFDPATGEVRQRILETDRGLACGNIYPWQVEQTELSFPDAKEIRCRERVVAHAVQCHPDKYSYQKMQEVLTSHCGDPEKFESVCNFGNNVAMIAAPQTRKLWFATRPACQTGFKTYSI